MQDNASRVGRKWPDLSGVRFVVVLSLLSGALAMGCGTSGSEPASDSKEKRETKATEAFVGGMGRECRALKERSVRAVKLFNPVRKSGRLPGPEQVPALVEGYKAYAKQLKRSAGVLARLNPPAADRAFLTDYVALVREEATSYRRAASGLSGAAPPRTYDPLDLSRPRNLQIALIDERGGRPGSCGAARLP